MTTTQDTRKALERRTEPKAMQTIFDLIERQQPAIEKALPAAIGAERFARVVMTEVRRTPALLECSPESLLGALMLSAQLGLEPGPLGHVYLVPFKKQVTFIVGYKGMIDLARRSNRLAWIEANTVREGDSFDYRLGTRSFLDHVPGRERGEATYYYAVAKLASPAGAGFRVLTPADVEAARKRSPMGREHKGPWQTDFEAMAWKTCVRRFAPWLPLTVQAGRALEVDERAVASFDDSGPELAPEAASSTEGTES